MADMKFTVHVTREGDSWLADVPSVAGAHTFSRSLDGLAKAVREVVVLMGDLEDDAGVELDFHYDLADEAVTEAERLRRIREAITIQEAELVSATARVASDLARCYSVRDTAAMLGVTAGRISQITNT